MRSTLILLSILVFIAPSQAIESRTDVNRDQKLTLVELIRNAIQDHPSIASSRAQRDVAQADMRAAQSQYFPTPSVQVLDDKNESLRIVTLQQPLWTGGRLDAALDSARSRAEAAQLAINDTQHTLALRVISTWASWIQARGRAESLEKGADLLAVYAASVGRRIEEGAAGEVDRELVAARLTQTQGELGVARSAERSALSRLSQILGRQLRAQELPRDSVPRQDAMPVPGLDALIAQALAQSAQLKRIQAEIDAALHETRQKRAARWPSVSLRAQHQQRTSSLSGSNIDTSPVMLVVEYSPGAGMSLGASIDAAESRSIALRDNLEATRRDLVELVTADYEDFLASDSRLQLLERTRKANAAVLASYDRLFIAGKRSWLDVINAAHELIQVETLIADLGAQQNAARARVWLHTANLQ